MEKIRQRIDQLDQTIVQLLEERMQAVEQVVSIKENQHLQVLDEGREQVVLEKVTQQIANKQFQPAILAIYEEILRSSKDYQTHYLQKKRS